MALTRFLARVDLRHARRWAASILLLALAGGAALTAAQAARRTDTAFTRALAAGHASDAVVNANTFTSDASQSAALRVKGLKLLDAVDRLPMVVAHGRFGGANLFVVNGDKVDQRFVTGSAFGLAAYDTRVGRTISTLRLSSGRLARPDRADEITINAKTARISGWRVGTLVTNLREYDPKEFDPATALPRAHAGTHMSMRVVGIGELPEELLQRDSEREPRVFLTPAFRQRFPLSDFYLNEWVRLRHGHADLAALRQAVIRVNRAAPEIGMPVSPTGDLLAKVNRANDPLVQGLWILAVLAAVVGILLAAQSLGRSFSARANDHAQLRAIGATRTQRFMAEITTLAVVALLAAVLAVVIGWLLSPLGPIGVARDAEPHPGFVFDLGLSAAAIAAIFVGTVVAALAAILGVAFTRELPGNVATDKRTRRSRVSDLIGRSGLGPSASIGTRLALQPGRGATATPVRSVLTSLTLVVAAVTATFAFGANLQRWTQTPRLYGWNWDAAIGSNFGGIPPEFEQPLAHYQNVVQAGGLTVGTLTVGRVSISAIGVDPVRGSVAPIVDAGRLPHNAHEVALGAKTMRKLHTRIGSTITGTVADVSVHLNVVGRTTFPKFGNERGGGTGLGTGALSTTGLFRMQNPDAAGEHFNYMLLRFAPGTATKSEQKLRAFLATQGCPDPTCLITDKSPSIRPDEIDGYRSARGLPLAVGVVLVLLLVATLTHVLVSTMRRRAADLAILRAIGSSSRNLVATLRWQALVLTASAILIGIPLGLIASRLAWRAFSSQVGIAPGTVTPLAIPALAAIGLLVLAWLLATLAGLRVPSIARRHRFSGQ
ncbi:MAG: putative transport system permease protein [Actinomycetota bacterium]|nr:putative transport system permease protein [Actinomycetota bacterium]